MRSLSRRLLLALGAATLALPALPPASFAADDGEIAVVVKITGIPWFNRFGEGVEKAGKDLGVESAQYGPTQADPAQQVKIVEDLIAKKVAAIVVVPNDAKALEPVFERAHQQGIVVVTHESPGQKGADWDVETIDNKQFAEAVFQKLADSTGGEGKFALFVGSLTVPLHNEWADIGLAYLKEKYPKLELVADRYPVGESLDDSFKTAQDILKAHPDLKGFVGFGSQGPIGFARALEQQGIEPGKVTVVGNILPKQATPYLKKGYITEGFLWDPSDAAFASVAIAKKLIDKQAIENGLEIAGLGKAEVNPETKVIKFNATSRFTADNVGEFNF